MTRMQAPDARVTDAAAKPRQDTPAGRIEKARHGSAHSRRYLAALCLTTVAAAALHHRAEILDLPQSLAMTLLQCGTCVIALMWMRDDARLRGSPIPGGGLLLAGTFLPLTVPTYILWTRRWKGLLVLVVVLLAILAAGIVGQSTARLALGLPIVGS